MTLIVQLLIIRWCCVSKIYYQSSGSVFKLDQPEIFLAYP